MNQFVLRLNLSKKLRGYTNSGLAEKLQVTEGTMKNYMSGRTDMPSSVIKDFANLLGVNLEWLMNGRGEMIRDEVDLSENKTEFLAEEQEIEYDTNTNQKQFLKLQSDAFAIMFDEINGLKSDIVGLRQEIKRLQNA